MAAQIWVAVACSQPDLLAAALALAVMFAAH